MRFPAILWLSSKKNRDYRGTHMKTVLPSGLILMEWTTPEVNSRLWWSAIMCTPPQLKFMSGYSKNVWDGVEEDYLRSSTDVLPHGSHRCNFKSKDNFQEVWWRIVPCMVLIMLWRNLQLIRICIESKIYHMLTTCINFLVMEDKAFSNQVNYPSASEVSAREWAVGIKC